MGGLDFAFENHIFAAARIENFAYRIVPHACYIDFVDSSFRVISMPGNAYSASYFFQNEFFDPETTFEADLCGGEPPGGVRQVSAIMQRSKVRIMPNIWRSHQYENLTIVLYTSLPGPPRRKRK